MFNTYVINLDDAKSKLTNITKNLYNCDIDFIRIPAINGNNIIKNKDEYNKYKNNISNCCYKICTASMIGCGLSHYIAAKKFLETDLDYCLILEDDAIPIYKNTKNIITELVNNYKNDYDIILLYCDGPGCNYKSKSIKPTGLYWSAVSYILSRSGAKKILDHKIKWHIDVQRYTMSNLNIYNHPIKLFTTSVEDSTTSTNRYNILKKLDKYNFISSYKNLPTSYYLQNQLLRIPYININILSIEILFIIILLISLFVYNKFK